MPVTESREDFACTVLTGGRRLTVTLPYRTERYTVEEVLTEAEIDCRGRQLRRAGTVIRITDIVEHGHVIEVIEVTETTTTTTAGIPTEIIVDVVAFGQRHSVRLPARDGAYTVEEVLRHSPISRWDGCQFRCNTGYTVTTTTVVENGQVIYVLTKIRGNC